MDKIHSRYPVKLWKATVGGSVARWRCLESDSLLLLTADSFPPRLHGVKISKKEFFFSTLNILVLITESSSVSLTWSKRGPSVSFRVQMEQMAQGGVTNLEDSRAGPFGTSPRADFLWSQQKTKVQVGFLTLESSLTVNNKWIFAFMGCYNPSWMYVATLLLWKLAVNALVGYF